MILLVTGGSGSGKSVWAEKTAHVLCPETKIYLATMQAADPESAPRIRRHRLQRAALNFETIECPLNLAVAPVPMEAVVLLEDVPNLLANEMFGGGNSERILPDLRALASTCSHLIMVTNDVFSDGFQYPESTRHYMEQLALINRELAESADIVVEVVYSIPVCIKGAFPPETA